MRLPSDARPATLLQHFAEEEKLLGAVVPPIFQNSLSVFEDSETLGDALGDPMMGPPHVYSRVSNPTLDVLERKLAMLEGSDAAKVFGSGMAAISTAILSCVSSCDHVVTVDTCYSPARIFFREFLPRFGVSTTFVDGRDPDDFREAIQPNTRLVYLESPSSAIFRLQDLAAVARICREKGIATICDNSYCTPLFQRPIDHGIDLVVHSASKYLGGHSDITAGVICCARERMEALTIQTGEVHLLGGALAPFPAWLMLRGLRTLELRVRRHEATANKVAAWLEAHAHVASVNHTALPTYEQRLLKERQMSGSGGLFSFVPNNQDRGAAHRFVSALQIFQRGVSWGGFESLAVSLVVQPQPEHEPTSVIRLYCGIEDPEDLIRDLDQAFERSEL